jgi:hypothetical protein
MHKHQCHNELKQKKNKEIFFGKMAVAAIFGCEFFFHKCSSKVKYRGFPRQYTTEIPHDRVLRNWRRKPWHNQKINPIKCTIPVFLRQKCVDTSYAWCLIHFGARFVGKKFRIWGLDWSCMEVDEKIVCRGSRWLFHLMKQFCSAVNYRGIPRQLTAAGVWIPRQLTAEGAKAYFTCVPQLSQMCEHQFSFLY